MTEVVSGFELGPEVRAELRSSSSSEMSSRIDGNGRLAASGEKFKMFSYFKENELKVECSVRTKDCCKMLILTEIAC